MSKKNKGLLFPNYKDIKVDLNEVPLNQYPRKQLERDSFMCLNGAWDFTISKSEEIPTSFDKKIMVPFAIESAYSNINHLIEEDDILYYHKVVKLEKSFVKDEIILHFEGVDQYCEVYINSQLVCKHSGGFTPFSITLKDIKDEFDIVLKVKDSTNNSYHSRGKQTFNITGYFYSSSSGIYKTVWLESINSDYVKDVIYTPNYDEKTLKVNVVTDKDDKCKIYINDKKYDISTNKDEIISLSDDFHPWSNESPYLYDVKIKYHKDEVKSYFGVRKIEIKEINGFKRICLNDKPVFISGLLDQGYYYIGNYTPKSYDEYLFDIQKTKEMGFNCLRKHIKTEMDMFYYYCDKQGILLIQDFPNGGGNYSFYQTVKARVLTFLTEKNINYKKMARTSKEGRDEFVNETYEYLKMYHNHPSILIYTIFNEGWGQFDSSKIYHDLKSKEDTKLFDTASGWYDADSDFYSIHTYTLPDMKRRDKRHRPFIISEMGGMSLKIENHSVYDGIFGHGIVKSKEELTDKYVKLYQDKILKQISLYGLNMTIYTELADCETEYNGIFTFDRQVQKIDTKILKDINESLYKEIDKCTK